MKYMFKRGSGAIPITELVSYQASIAGLLSLLYCETEYISPREHLVTALLITAVLFAIAAITSVVCLVKQYKKEGICNVFFLLRAIGYGILCGYSIVSRWLTIM